MRKPHDGGFHLKGYSMSEKVRYNRWLILAASCLLVFATGCTYIFSLLKTALEKEFGSDDAVMAYSVLNAISPIPMILGGYFVDRGKTQLVALAGGTLWGLGWLLGGLSGSGSMFILCFGVIGGLGQGFAYTAALNNTMRFFPDRRGMAAGLITGANGGAAIVMAPLARWILDDRGIVTTMGAFGVAFLAVAVLVALTLRQAPANYAPEGWTPPAPASGGPAAEAKNFNWRQMCMTPMFWLIFVIFVCGAFSGLLIVANASPLAQGMFGYSKSEAAFIVSVYAFASLAGRICFGTVSDKIGRVRTVQIIFILAALGLISLIAGKGDHNVLPLVLGIFAVGMGYGGIMGTMPALVMSQFGPKNQGINYGVAFSAFAVSAIFAPNLGAKIGKSNGGDYSQALVIAIVAAAVGLCAAIAYQIVAARLERRAAAQQ